MAEYNKIRDVMVGLAVFAAHGGKECDAQHDILYAGQADGEVLSEEEVAELHDHGWFIDSENCSGCAEEGDARTIPAVPDAGEDEGRHKPSCTYWAIFT
jgi:hypothetical protein